MTIHDLVSCVFKSSVLKSSVFPSCRSEVRAVPVGEESLDLRE